MAWTAPKIASMLQRMPSSAWKPTPTQFKTTKTSPRQLGSMEKSGVK
jgi:hypothetical protein